jgi:translation initiation factor eIF-2B subunit gamma
MSELRDKCEEDKSWNIRQSLLRRYGSVKCLTRYRDAHIYLFPYWVKDFARLNQDFESVSEDLVGTWAKTEWRKPTYRARFGMPKLFGRNSGRSEQMPIEDEIDLLSLSSTRTTRTPASPTSTAKQTAKLASRVHTGLDDGILGSEVKQLDADAGNNWPPLAPPILSYILPSAPSAPLIRRVDTTPLLLSVSLLLAKIPSLEEIAPSGKHNSTTSPFAHQSKVAGTATIAPQVTITRSDTLIDSNTTIASKCVIKASVIGSSVNIGAGTRLTNCLVMDGASVGERCVLTGTVVGKKVKIGKGCTLSGCEVQDGNVLGDGTDGKKGEKFLVGGLEDAVGGGGEGFTDGGDEGPWRDG